jgi:cytochrome c-type biogenesis protein CcmH
MRPIPFIFILFTLLLTPYSLLPTFALAQTPEYNEINDIAKQLNCPTCAGQNLADCRTMTCEQWRGQINDLLQQGYTEQEVLDYFSTQYGTQVLQEPPRSGFTLILWVLPLVALLLGGGWLYYTLRDWSAQNQTAAPATPPAGDAAAGEDYYLDQVEQDLGLK